MDKIQGEWSVWDVSPRVKSAGAPEVLIGRLFISVHKPLVVEPLIGPQIWKYVFEPVPGAQVSNAVRERLDFLYKFPREMIKVKKVKQNAGRAGGRVIATYVFNPDPSQEKFSILEDGGHLFFHTGKSEASLWRIARKAPHTH